jgi:hypothetical protein
MSQTLSGLLGTDTSKRPFTLNWSHYVFLLGIQKAEERSSYEIESAQQNWTLRDLRHQFQSGLYERLALSRDKDGIPQLAGIRAEDPWGVAKMSLPTNPSCANPKPSADSKCSNRAKSVGSCDHPSITFNCLLKNRKQHVSEI